MARYGRGGLMQHTTTSFIVATHDCQSGVWSQSGNNGGLYGFTYSSRNFFGWGKCNGNQFSGVMTCRDAACSGAVAAYGNYGQGLGYYTFGVIGIAVSSCTAL